MANRILLGCAQKIVDDGVITWRYVYELCQGGEIQIDQPTEGEVDGTNTVYQALYGNWVKTDGNNAEVTDVIAKVDASAVTIASIDDQLGTVTLQSAPPSGVVTLTYPKCKGVLHKEIIVEASEMTLPTDADEALAKANVKAVIERTAYLARIAAAPTITAQSAQEGPQTL